MYCVQTCNILKSLSLEVELFFKSELHIARFKQCHLPNAERGQNRGGFSSLVMRQI